MSRTFLALLHYDGTRFVGWQRQPNGRSVQGEFEAVLERLCRRRVVAHGAGRTDAGVHALGMGVSFTLPAKWTGPEIRRALNALLPGDCWVMDIRETAPGFHARKSAAGRRYRYVVGTDEAAHSPFRRGWEWALTRPLRFGRLTHAAADLTGEHDFRAFAVKSGPRPHYRCTVREAVWRERQDAPGVVFEIAADRFLHHMVRFLVGTMVDIGLERRPPSDMAALLRRTENDETSPPAPPQGLFFLSAEYSEQWFV